jgi:hypothetical protein
MYTCCDDDESFFPAIQFHNRIKTISECEARERERERNCGYEKQIFSYIRNVKKGRRGRKKLYVR